MTNANFTFDLDAEGIALITWDMPGKSMNVFTATAINELEALIARVGGDAAIKGAVITSGKAGSFSGGADLTMLEGLSRLYQDEAKANGEEAAVVRLFDESRRMSQMFRALEKSGKPWVAAINGVCLGGAFELALACHSRIAAENPKTRLGLPEVKVGLFPGAGGTQRVPRMIPAIDALQMLLKGEALRLERAKSMRLIDEIVPQEQLISRAKDIIRGGLSAVKPWDQDNFKLPGGPVWSKSGFMTWPAANGLYRRETYDNYPGARAILKVVFDGLQLPMDRALTVESRHFAHILRSKEAAAMIRSLFVSMQELNKGARRPEGIAKTELTTIGILGAGFMGAGIAYVSAQAGVNVVLVDRDIESAEKGKAYSHKLITGQILKGRAKGADRDALLGRITATADYAALKDCQLVIEAVFEDRAVKAEATGKAAAVLGKDAVFASNTSTLPISSLAEAYPDQGNFIGIHFFSPVEKMMLVEVIRGKNTSDRALARALDFVQKIKKTPIVVQDARGFFTSRTVLQYVREGHTMLTEGIPAAMVENAGRMAGMPVGPLALNDEVALDLGYKILQATKKDLGDKYHETAEDKLLARMVTEFERFGRKNGKGFYDYPETGKKKLWPGLKELGFAAINPEDIQITDLKNRLLAIQAIETVKIWSEGVLTDVREADVGAILGFGFAPFTGGPLSWIDGMGTRGFHNLCAGLAEKYGPRFAPPELIKQMAVKNESFYERFPPEKRASKAA
jgi:3-hydroxyacyl-CoA dehydrogenase/enoyl-CoA hydratase/3-hydroxybutyryl-CoA epimerase